MSTAVEVHDVSKKFSRNAQQHLNYGIRDLLREVFGAPRTLALRPDEFLAVDHVSFALPPGESFAIIGRNGSGKTTLLKMIAGLIKPDGGKIIVRGRVQALINLGAGFNMSLSGRENVYNAAALMGFGPRDTRQILDSVIDFAELEEFIDSPVETYSSGMKARLGFAVAIHLRPQILIVDEILAVGDHAFQNKCFLRMQELRSQGVTLLIVTHNHTRVVQMCDRALWMHKGRTMMLGTAQETVQAYLDFLERTEQTKSDAKTKKSLGNSAALKQEGLYGPIHPPQDGIRDIQVQIRHNGNETNVIPVHGVLNFEYSFFLDRYVNDLNVTVNFYRKDGLHLATISTLKGDLLKSIHNGRVHASITINDVVFVPGQYVIVMPIHDGHSYLFRDVVAEFNVTGKGELFWALVDLPYSYRVHTDAS